METYEDLKQGDLNSVIGNRILLTLGALALTWLAAMVGNLVLHLPGPLNVLVLGCYACFGLVCMIVVGLWYAVFRYWKSMKPEYKAVLARQKTYDDQWSRIEQSKRKELPCLVKTR